MTKEAHKPYLNTTSDRKNFLGGMFPGLVGIGVALFVTLSQRQGKSGTMVGSNAISLQSGCIEGNRMGNGVFHLHEIMNPEQEQPE